MKQGIGCLFAGSLIATMVFTVLLLFGWLLSCNIERLGIAWLTSFSIFLFCGLSIYLKD